VEPLTEKNLNVATVRPMSKIPMFGSSGIRPPTGVPSSFKRTLDKDEVSMMFTFCAVSGFQLPVLRSELICNFGTSQC